MASLQDYLYIADKLNPVTGLAKQAATPVAIAGGLASDAAIDTAAAGLGLNRAKPLGITQDAIAGANEINKPLVKLSDVKTGLAQTLAGHLGLSLPEAKAAPVVDNNPLALSANESVVKPGAKLPAAQPAGYGGALSKFSPAEQQAIIDDAKKSGVSSFGVMYDPNAPATSAPKPDGGNRILAKVAQPETVPPVAAPRFPALTDANAGSYLEDNGVVEVIRPREAGGIIKSYLMPDGTEYQADNLQGAITSANAYYQRAADRTSALAKPVGANLTYGEAKAIGEDNASKNATELAKEGIQAKASTDTAGITANAHIKGAEIAADAGKNKILDLAVQDINTTTDPKLRANKIATYLSGKQQVEDPSTPAITKLISEEINPVTKKAMSDLAEMANKKGLTGDKKLEYVRDNAAQLAATRK